MPFPSLLPVDSAFCRDLSYFFAECSAFARKFAIFAINPAPMIRAVSVCGTPVGSGISSVAAKGMHAHLLDQPRRLGRRTTGRMENLNVDRLVAAPRKQPFLRARESPVDAQYPEQLR